MAGRISVAEFMKTEEAAFRYDATNLPRAKENGDPFEGYAPEGVYFLLDDSRVMLLSTSKYMS